MKIINFIEARDIIEKILCHLNSWDIRNHDLPAKQQAYIPELFYDYSDTQIPVVDYWD